MRETLLAGKQPHNYVICSFKHKCKIYLLDCLTRGGYYHPNLGGGVPPEPQNPDPIPDLILVILYTLSQTKGQFIYPIPD